MGKTQKNDRTSALAIAVVIASAFFAYGFSNQNAWFHWKLPLAVLLGAAAWAFMPRFTKQRESGESA